MDNKMCEQKITWDNSYIGEINSLVKESKEDSKSIIVELKFEEFNIETAILFNFESFIPLICEEFKDLFKLRRSGKHIVKYQNKHMLMSKFDAQINLKEYMKINNIKTKNLPQYIINEVQKFIAFRWLICLKNIKENSLNIVFDKLNSPYIVSFFENEINYNSKTTKRLIDDWFENLENFYQVVKSLIDNRDISLLRFEIQKIIEKYDKNLIGWSNVIFNRMSGIY
jgi:hypothetical protein